MSSLLSCCEHASAADGCQGVEQHAGQELNIPALSVRACCPRLRVSALYILDERVCSIAPGKQRRSPTILGCPSFDHSLVLLLQGPHVSCKLGGQGHAAGGLQPVANSLQRASSSANVKLGPALSLSATQQQQQHAPTAAGSPS